MPARLPFRLAAQPLAVRLRPQPQFVAQASLRARGYADQKPKLEPAAPAGSPAEKQEEAKQAGDPNASELKPLGHVSEEAAATSEVTGGGGPELEQGTPIQDIAKGDKEVQSNLPKVMQDAIKKNQTRPYSTFARQPMAGRRTFSTSSKRHEDLQMTQDQYNSALEHNQQDRFDDEEDFEYEADEDELGGVPALVAQGHKFALPALPLPPGSNLRKRYDTLVDQVTKLLMRDGKLSVAQRNMNAILTHLRVSPAPRPSPARPLLPSAPPHTTLPLNPTLYLTTAIDSVAPLFRLRSQRGAAGGGMALQIPIPLRQRQRRRTAIMWMLDAAEKRKGGTSGFAKRFAEEVVAVAEGRSACWARREALHGLGVRARANLSTGGQRGGRR